MCRKFLLVFFVFAYISSSRAGPVSFIQKCKADDLKCLKQSTQNAVSTYADGIPELGLEPLDPVHSDRIDASSNQLKLLLSDITVSGLKKCLITKALRDNPLTKLTLGGVCTLNVDGKYDISGRLLILPIEGHGEIHVVLNKLEINVEADMVEKVGKDGKVHWDIKSWRHTYSLQDRAKISLQNLFDGNEALGLAATQLLDGSPNEIVNEVGPPIIKAILTKVVKSVDKFFRHVPVEDLTLD